jgi:hypothetical protein
VVLAQDAAAAVEGVLVQVAGGLYLAQLAQVVSQDGGRTQSAAVVLAQDAAMAVKGVLVQVAGRRVARGNLTPGLPQNGA